MEQVTKVLNVFDSNLQQTVQSCHFIDLPLSLIQEIVGK